MEMDIIFVTRFFKIYGGVRAPFSKVWTGSSPLDKNSDSHALQVAPISTHSFHISKHVHGEFALIKIIYRMTDRLP